MKPRIWIANPAQGPASHYLRSTFVAAVSAGSWEQLYPMLAILYDLDDQEPRAFRQLLRDHSEPATKLRALERWAERVGPAAESEGPIQVVMPNAQRLNSWLRARVRAFPEFDSILTEDTATLLALARGADIALGVQRQRERKLSALPRSLLLQGPTGAGKEMLAKALHQISQNRHHSATSNGFGPVNCGGLPTELIESELFGHKQGAFTGAVRDREGVIETHASGTVFLDEIGDTPAEVQVRLLRFLNDGEVRRVGEDKPKRAWPWVIGATHRDLRQQVEQRQFREDLMFRLLGDSVTLPALASKRSDIMPVLSQCIERHAGRPIRASFVESARVALETYRWPGNLRELSQVAGALVGNLSEKAAEIIVELGALPIAIQHHYLSHRSTVDQFLDLYRHRVSQQERNAGGEPDLREALVTLYETNLKTGHPDLRFALVLERLFESKLFAAMAGNEVALKAHAIAVYRRETAILERSDHLRKKLAAIDGIPAEPPTSLVSTPPSENELPSWVKHVLGFVEEASSRNSTFGATFHEIMAMLERLSPAARTALEEFFAAAIREVQAESATGEDVEGVAPGHSAGHSERPEHRWELVRGQKELFERYLRRYGTAAAMARAFGVSDRTVRNAAKTWNVNVRRGGARAAASSGSTKRQAEGRGRSTRG